MWKDDVLLYDNYNNQSVTRTHEMIVRQCRSLQILAWHLFPVIKYISLCAVLDHAKIVGRVYVMTRKLCFGSGLDKPQSKILAPSYKMCDVSKSLSKILAPSSKMCDVSCFSC